MRALGDALLSSRIARCLVETMVIFTMVVVTIALLPRALNRSQPSFPAAKGVIATRAGHGRAPLPRGAKIGKLPYASKSSFLRLVDSPWGFATHLQQPTRAMNPSQLNVTPVVSMPFDENAYVVWLEGSAQCLVFDPGLEPDKIIDFINAQGLEPAAIVNTHGHADHIAGNEALKECWPRAPLVIGANEAAFLTDPVLNLSAGFGMELISPPADQTVAHGERFSAAGLELDVYEIPGHSPGHVVFVWRGGSPHHVLGGDVLFAGSIGRTDFPGGSLARLTQGIHQHLFTLPDDTLVWPGHGPRTTVGEEKRRNPFVGRPAGYRG